MMQVRGLSMTTDRRSLLKLVTAAAIPGAWTTGCATAQTRFDNDPFALGVASGPSERGIVLWTRVVPGIEAQIGRLSDLGVEGYAAARRDEVNRAMPDVDVRWEVADDENFRNIVRRGTARASTELGHSVHVELDGLEPSRWFWYRFMAGDAVSPVGRTRMPDAADSPRSALRLALASCQHYETGFFGAYRHMRADDPELVLFVGDYIYEGGPNRKRWRPHPFPSARTLFDYRLRHALYRLDPDLQAMHAHCPWLLTWDDHEVSNDYARDVGEDPAVDGHARRLAGYQAYYEHLPIPAATLIERFSHVRLYRTHRAAALASFIVLDDRQYRDRQACQPASRGGSSMIDDPKCPQRRDPDRTLLGREQMAWLAQQFARSRTRWNFVVQQTLFSSLNYDPKIGRFWNDGWDGYPAERSRVIAAISKTKLRNPVILGGDVHSNWVCDVKRDFDDSRSPVIASEFCGTAISSLNGWDVARAARIAELNPHVRFADVEHRGYVLGDVDENRLKVQLRVIDDGRQRTPGISTLAKFEVDEGRPGPIRVPA
jgi:alkaline phosphatase D